MLFSGYREKSKKENGVIKGILLYKDEPIVRFAVKEDGIDLKFLLDNDEDVKKHYNRIIYLYKEMGKIYNIDPFSDIIKDLIYIKKTKHYLHQLCQRKKKKNPAEYKDMYIYPTFEDGMGPLYLESTLNNREYREKKIPYKFFQKIS